MKARLLLVISVTQILAGCAISSMPAVTTMPTVATMSTQIAMPSATTSPTYTPKPTLPSYVGTPRMPDALVCSQFPAGEQGYAWNNLTIGLSTLDDVLRQYSDAMQIWNEDGSLSLVSKTDIGEPGWYRDEACFRDQILVALLIKNTEKFPQGISKWIDQFGAPDKVTWGADECRRSVIWAERGILAHIDFENDDTDNVMFFPPLRPTELKSSWLLAALPTERQKPGDVIMCDPSAPEDRWDVERPAP